MREPFEVSAVFHFNPLKVLDVAAPVFFRPTEGHERTGEDSVQKDMIYHITMRLAFNVIKKVSGPIWMSADT